MPSVAHASSNSTDTVSKRFCAPLMGPNSARFLLTAALPPGMLSLSGGNNLRTMKISTADMITAHGAPAINQSIHDTRAPSILSMKPTVSRFCAAAV
ncbi:hypothetical protein D3C76_1270200 [compost metagenome]